MSLATDMYSRLLRLEAAGCDSLKLLDLELRRVELGYSRYGALKLAEDARDWRLERIEEWLDGRMYDAAGELCPGDEWRMRRRQAEAEVAASPVAISYDLHNIECAAAVSETCSAGCPAIVSTESRHGR